MEFRLIDEAAVEGLGFVELAMVRKAMNDPQVIACAEDAGCGPDWLAATVVRAIFSQTAPAWTPRSVSPSPRADPDRFSRDHHTQSPSLPVTADLAHDAPPPTGGCPQAPGERCPLWDPAHNARCNACGV